MPNDNASKSRRRGRLLLRVLSPIVVLVLAVFAASSLLDTAPKAGRRPPPERQARLVEVTAVEHSVRPVVVSAWGEVRPAREVVLRAQVTGLVADMHAELVPGGRLPAGATALEIERDDYALQLEQARGELVRAQADLALEQGQQAVARREFELLGKKPSAKERSLMLREPQLETARASVAAAKAAVAAAELALERTQVKTPFDALVLERTVATGATVASSTDIATLAATDRWWVEVAVPVSALQWIEVGNGNPGSGSLVRLYDDAAWGGGNYREGRVVRRYGALEQQGRMARLLVEVSDPLALEPANAGKPAMLIGAFLRAEIHGRTLQNVVALEPGWLRQDDVVWLMNAEDRLELRPVKIAYRGTDYLLVADGLAPGERVVTTPINAAAEGMPLRVRAPAAGGQRNGR